MLNRLAPPAPVAEKLEQLYKLVEQYPTAIPVPKLAEFLGADDEGLRSSIDAGQCPFAIGWRKSLKGYRAYKVPTVPFYLWYTQGVGFRA